VGLPWDDERVPTVGPTPIFHELPVLVEFQRSIPVGEARRIHAGVYGAVRRLVEGGAKADGLPDAIAAIVAQYGYTARLVGRTREAMEFAITKPQRVRGASPHRRYFRPADSR
jgi:hypothetical protein